MKRWYSLVLASTAMPSSPLMAFSSSLRKYSRWLLEIFSLSCSWIFFWIFSSSCSFLMKIEHVLHARLHVGHLEDLLLLGLVDVEDGGDEVRDLARVVDVDHGEAHLLGEQGVVLRDLLHLADERAGEGLHLRGVEVLVLQVLRPPR